MTLPRFCQAQGVEQLAQAMGQIYGPALQAMVDAGRVGFSSYPMPLFLSGLTYPSYHLYHIMYMIYL